MKQIKAYIFIILLIFISNTYITAQDNTQVGLPEGAIARLGKGGINIMRFSPDGSYLAVGTDVGVWLYDLPDGNETALFTERTGQINALAFSHDRKILACGGFNNSVIQLWDVGTLSKLTTFELNDSTDAISALAFSDDNRTLVSLVMFGQIILWDVKSGSKTLLDLGSVHLNEAAAISQNGSIFVIAEDNGKINLWDVDKRKKIATLKGHSSLFKGDSLTADAVSDIFNLPRNANVSEFAFSSDGKMFASGSLDHTIQVWNVEKRKKLATLKGHQESVTSIAFSNDGKLVAGGDENKAIKIWDIDTRRERATLTGHKNAIYALAFSPNGETLASGSSDGTIRFWNPNNGEEIALFATGYTESVKAVAFSENDTTLASATSIGTVEVWGLNTWQELTTFTVGQNFSTSAVALTSDATHFAYQDRDKKGHNSIQLWEIATGKKIPGPWQNIKTQEIAFTFSSDNKTIVVSSHQGIHAWDINTQLELFHYKTEQFYRSNLVFSPNGTLIATNGNHARTRIWNISKQREIGPSHIKNATTLAFSPDGSLLAHEHYKDGIVLWDVTPSGIQERGKIPNSQSGFRAVLVFSPDSQTLLDVKSKSWRKDKIQLWDVATGADLGTLSGHTEEITMLVFSHNGQTLASCSKDGTVLLWNWNKIVSENAIDNIEIENKLIPPKKIIKYAGKAEEAEAVINWLQNNGYQIKKSGKGYDLIRRGKSISHVSGRSSISGGDIFFALDQNGFLRIRVGGVGTGTYFLNEKDNLKYVNLDEEN